MASTAFAAPVAPPSARPYTEYTTFATLGGYLAEGGERGGELSLLRGVFPHGGEFGKMGAIGLYGATYGVSIGDEVRYLEVEGGMSVWGAIGAMLGAGPRVEADERGWQATLSVWYFAPILFARHVVVADKSDLQFGAMIKLPLPVAANSWELVFGDDESEAPVPP